MKSNSGEQNKDMSKARQKRAAKDTLVILTTIADRDPFSADPNLRNIMTDYTFKRSSQAVTLAAKSSERIESDTVQASRLKGLKATLCR